jgi:peptidoglycan/LPS O-acetylase OafA/YrhL
MATALLVSFSLVYDRIAVSELFKEMTFLVAFVTLIPLAFVFQHRYRFDSWVGNLSYPIYICHMLVIDTMRYMIIGKIWALDFHFAISALSVLVSILFAIALNKFIGAPFERLRDRLRNGTASLHSVVGASAAVA